MTTIRVERRHRYTSIDRGALNDARLSFRARGILAYLLDKPDDWRTNASAVAAAGREGREAVRTALRELETCGYLHRRKWRNLSGQWETEWIVRERPDEDQSTRAGFRARVTGPGFPAPVSRAVLLNTETEEGPTERLFDSDEIAPPPWRDAGMTYDEWVRSGGLAEDDAS